MKTTHPMKSPKLLQALAACLLLASTGAHAAETFATLKIGDTMRTNVTVIRTNAAELILLFYGGGATVKREDLPEPLKSLYPYDPDAAAAFERERAAQKKAWSEQERADTYATLLRKEQGIQGAIAKSQRDLVELQKEIGVRANQARGRRPNHPFRIALDQARERKIGLARQVEQLNQELASVRALQPQYR
jgi:hypothetical protein